MKYSPGLAFLCLILIFSLLAHAGEFSWDLADREILRDWEVVSGDWAFRNGWWEVRSTSINPGVALIKEDFAAAHGLFTHDGMVCEVTFEELGDGNWKNQFIVFAYAPDADEGHVYQAGQRVGNGQWSIERMDIAVAGREAFQEEFRLRDGGTQGSDFVCPNREYNFRLEIKGDTIIIYNSNREQMRFTFGGDLPATATLNQIMEIPVGRIGISNDNAHTRFKNFRISGPEVQQPVEPAGKLAATWGRTKAMELSQKSDSGETRY